MDFQKQLESLQFRIAALQQALNESLNINLDLRTINFALNKELGDLKAANVPVVNAEPEVVGTVEA